MFIYFHPHLWAYTDKSSSHQKFLQRLRFANADNQKVLASKYIYIPKLHSRLVRFSLLHVLDNELYFK